ncbi:MAG: hypothetical protein ACFFBJ_01305 [Promethearchaeota archaeon]
MAVSGVCHGHNNIRRFVAIVLDFRIGSGPGGNSPKDEWWSPRGSCLEKHNELTHCGKDIRYIGSRCTFYFWNFGKQ